MKRAGRVLGAAIFIVCLAACGNTTGQRAAASPSPVSSPTPDAVTQKYVALIRSYWDETQAADIVVNSSNVAARVCLGNAARYAATDLALVDPAMCRERAIALETVQERFLVELASTPAPQRFAADDGVFRAQVPKAISHLKAMIAACATANNQTIHDATTAFVADLIPAVTDAMDDVDPATRHI